MQGVACSSHTTCREYTTPLEMDRHNRASTILEMVWEDGEQEGDASSGFLFRRFSMHLGVWAAWTPEEVASVYADGNAGCVFSRDQCRGD